MNPGGGGAALFVLKRKWAAGSQRTASSCRIVEDVAVDTVLFAERVLLLLEVGLANIDDFLFW